MKLNPAVTGALSSASELARVDVASIPRSTPRRSKVETRRGTVRSRSAKVSLSLEEAVVYALAHGQPAVAVSRAPRSASGGQLSRGEREVVAIVPLGLSNRQIAAQMVITKRTARTHVERILAKLVLLAFRALLGVWASAHELVVPGSSSGAAAALSSPEVLLR